VNNKDKEIIILNKNVFSKCNFNFVKISEDKTLSLEDDFIINEIFVYGISNNSHKLFHFDEEFKLIETMDILISILITVFNNKLSFKSRSPKYMFLINIRIVF